MLCCVQGLVQYYFPMGDGSGLKLTAAKYLTPKAYDITKFGGLTPDFACKDYPHGANRREGSHVVGWRCSRGDD
jgi:C-terminal processing protease CtpA/Prc